MLLYRHFFNIKHDIIFKGVPKPPGCLTNKIGVFK